jgi:hypothetical protein
VESALTSSSLPEGILCTGATRMRRQWLTHPNPFGALYFGRISGGKYEDAEYLTQKSQELPFHVTNLRNLQRFPASLS